MAITLDQVKSLFASPEIRAVEHAIAAAVGIQYELDRPEILDTLAMFGLRDLALTPLTLEDVVRRLQTDSVQIIRLATAVNREAGISSDLGQFPAGERPGPNDAPGPVLSRAFSSGFAVLFVIYVYFLAERPRGELVAFLKARRCPGAAKFDRQLRRQFIEAGGRPAAE